MNGAPELIILRHLRILREMTDDGWLVELYGISTLSDR